MRIRPLAALACLAAAAAAGCGGGGEPRAQTPRPPVTVDVTAPGDMATVRTATLEVRGTVAPADAFVQVLGQPATVSGGGRFSARVPLDPGANVVDLVATAGGRAPTFTAFRVTREVPVEVPDLDGLEVAAVEEKLGVVGLGVGVEQGGGLLEPLLPGKPAVCRQDPEPGTKVRRGTTVHVVVAKSC
jgi:hypothetical protein